MLELNKNNFEEEVVKSDKPVIVDFWAEWCPPCKMLGPVFEELSGEMENLKFAKVNVDENQELAGQFGVRSIPTLVLFKSGKEADRISGFMPKEQLKEKLEEMTG